jgi:dipeptidase E
MKKIILTSAGFENKKIAFKFLELINLPAEKIKVLFITSAAVTNEQKAIIPLCHKELIDIGLKNFNIKYYDFEELINYENYDAIYVCGGSTQSLLKKMKENAFEHLLEKFLNKGGIYLGVSAGSIALAKNFPEGLGMLNCILKVHSKENEKTEITQPLNQEIKINDNQAIVIEENKIYFFE